MSTEVPERVDEVGGADEVRAAEAPTTSRAGPSEIDARWLGAAIGAATGPAVGFGQAWGRTGDGRAWVWVLAVLVLAFLGAVTLPVFVRKGPGASGHETHEVGPGFGALFGFAVGLVGGAFVAFPMGSAIGALGGLVAGAGAVFGARVLRSRAVGPEVAAGLGSVVGAALALGVLAIWM